MHIITEIQTRILESLHRPTHNWHSFPIVIPHTEYHGRSGPSGGSLEPGPVHWSDLQPGGLFESTRDHSTAARSPQARRGIFAFLSISELMLD